MSKLAFLPFGAAAGAAAGFLSTKLFRSVWALIDDEQPPEPKHRRARVTKLALALALQGATISVLSGLADHGSRRGFEQLTGSWPGDEEPQPAGS